MSAAYAIALVAVSVLALLVTAVLLRRWERSPAEAGAQPKVWWRSWQRTLLLAVVAAGCGAVGPLSGPVHTGAWPLFTASYAVLPIIYHVVGIRVAGYRIEQLLAWSVWGLTAVALGAPRGDAAILAALALVPCLAFGAVIVRLGVTRARTWQDIWTRQA